MRVFLLAAAAALRAGCVHATQPPSVDVLAPNDALSLAVGARRLRVCGTGSSALIVVRNVLLEQHGTRLCVALSAPDGGTSFELRVADQSADHGAEVCLPPGFGFDISPALAASTALLVPISALPGSGLAQDRTGTLRLRAALRDMAGTAVAETAVDFTVLVEARPGVAGSPGCVGRQRFDDAAEVAGLYCMLLPREATPTLLPKLRLPLPTRCLSLVELLRQLLLRACVQRGRAFSPHSGAQC
jgi:hypothetical protein